MCYRKALLTTAAHQYYRHLFGNDRGVQALSGIRENGLPE
jgi:hypothetical protein